MSATSRCFITIIQPNKFIFAEPTTKYMNASKLELKDEKMQKAEVTINFSRLDDSQLVTYFSKPEHVENAFRDLLRRFQDKVYNHVRSMVLSHRATDEISCSVFLKFWDNISEFRTTNLNTTIFRMASNETIAFLKKQYPLIDFDEAQPEFADFLNEKETLNSNSEAIKIQKAMCYLTYKQKLVFNLKYFDQLSYDEISDLTQTSETALKTTYHHAIKKLEIYLNVLNQGGTKNEL